MTASTLSINLWPARGWLPAQEEAAGLVEDPDGPRVVLLSGGMGSGKSYWLAAMIYRLHFLHVQYAQRLGIDPARVQGGLLAPTYDLLQRTMRSTLVECAADLGLHPFVEWKTAARELHFTVGGRDFGRVIAYTAETPERIIGANLCYAAVDEPGTPRKGDALARLMGRLRSGDPAYRKIPMSGTPEDVASRAWFYDFIASPDTIREHGREGDNSRRIVYASTLDNHHIDDVAGFVEGMRQVYSNAQQEAYIHGRFTSFSEGKAYAGFIDRCIDLGGNTLPTDHDAFKVPPRRGMPILLTFDFNVSPMSALVMIPNGPDGVTVIDEIYIPKAGTEGKPAIQLACETFREKAEDGFGLGWPSMPVGPLMVYGDATEKRVTAAASRSGWDIVRAELEPWLKARGCEYVHLVPYANPPEADRVNVMNAALQQGRVLVAERCVHLRKDLNLVAIKEGTNRLDKTSDPSLTHLSDALGYAVYARSPAVVPRASQGELQILMDDSPDLSKRWDWGG